VRLFSWSVRECFPLIIRDPRRCLRHLTVGSCVDAGSLGYGASPARRKGKPACPQPRFKNGAGRCQTPWFQWAKRTIAGLERNALIWRGLKSPPLEGGWNDPWKLLQGIRVLSQINSQSASPTSNNPSLQQGQEERFVDAAVGATFLSISRKHVLRLSRLGRLPAHPISFGQRITWRYLISELRAWVLSNNAKTAVASTIAVGRRMAGGSPRRGGR
jgi:hypothetical protein